MSEAVEKAIEKRERQSRGEPEPKPKKKPAEDKGTSGAERQ
jgi:hypothetical protein